jgi:hypothetical protein
VGVLLQDRAVLDGIIGDTPMAISKIKKRLEIPPAHYYLEDIETIISLMEVAAKKRLREGQELSYDFELGDRRIACENVEDLKKVGGRWKEFAVNVGNGEFKVDPFWGTRCNVFDEDGATFNAVLRLATVRESKVRAAFKLIPFWVVVGWLGLGEFLVRTVLPKHIPVAAGVAIIALIAVPALVRAWAASAHSIVELRYSHEPSPKWATLKAQSGKAAWLVVGTGLTLLVQWLWKHYLGQ